MRFSFVHAADLHIDSPLAGLGVKDPAVAKRFAQAGRCAVDRLIRQTIETEAAFLVIAGDVFDGDWKDVTTGLYFARQLGELHRNAIPTFMIKGNHDADSVVSQSLPYPDSVRVFSSRKAESVEIASRRVVLHGRSFASRKVSDDFVATYPSRREGWLNIGILHTALDGTRGHESYAPCTAEALARFGYDYWALGHVHAGEIVCRDPWIVYPGNIQGRSVRECGAKGAMRVTVDDGRIVEVAPMVLDGARWAHERVDVSACHDDADALACIEAALALLHPEADGRPIAVRLTLCGATAAHARLVTRREEIEANARALAFRFADDCWIERIAIETCAPALPFVAAESDLLDIEALIAAAAEEPAFAADLAATIETIADKLPRHLRAALASDGLALARLRGLARDHLAGTLAQEAPP